MHLHAPRLGLSLIEGLVDWHGGNFARRSQLGVGTTATVRFPPPPAGAEAGMQPVPDQPGAAASIPSSSATRAAPK